MCLCIIETWSPDGGNLTTGCQLVTAASSGALISDGSQHIKYTLKNKKKRAPPWWSANWSASSFDRQTWRTRAPPTCGWKIWLHESRPEEESAYLAVSSAHLSLFTHAKTGRWFKTNLTLTLCFLQASLQRILESALVEVPAGGFSAV